MHIDMVVLDVRDNYTEHIKSMFVCFIILKLTMESIGSKRKKMWRSGGPKKPTIFFKKKSNKMEAFPFR